MKQCQLCDTTVGVVKRRVQILPSYSKCIELCKGCLPKIKELILATRNAYLEHHDAY